MSQTLIFGAGWIGNQFLKHIKKSILSLIDITDSNLVEKELERVNPSCIINCAGKTGKPNIDSCEKNPEGTLRANLAGAVLLASAAKKRDIQFVQMSSGCLYEGNNEGKGFTEESPPNFLGSVYSRSKALAESALRDLGALQLRIRMPISETPGPRNLITKLVGYRKVIHMANSVTVLEDFFPVAFKLIEQGNPGVFNIVNEGMEYHDELLKLYQNLVDPQFQFEVIPLEILKEKLVAGRSNCILSTEKIRQMGLGLPPIEDSLKRILPIYALNLQRESEEKTIH